MKRATAALAMVPLLALGACSETDSVPDADKPAERSADCLDVSMRAMKDIASGEWVPIRGAAVVGPDFADTMYLVAIEFETGGGRDVGVWATPDLRNPGPIMSVDGMAASFSNWPQGTAAEPLDATVTGVDEAKDCLA